ncbi:MAG: AGE family epimerase/isomerase [Melioribacteraceae bacterium]|nr:AGE family epimerase/isomerase [Melioribacteraceae bacterium]
MEIKVLEKFKASASDILENNILSYWINNTQDNDNGGFYGRITDNGIVEKDSPKGLILNSRILWTFSNAAAKYPGGEYSKIADRAYNYLMDKFEDKVYGGFYWMLDSMGNPIDDCKKIYGQAFTIYGLAEYFNITKNEAVLKKAIELFHKIEEHNYDKINTGYFEVSYRNWKLANDVRLSEVDMNEQKSMNNHLHIIEAYTNLYRYWKNPVLKEKIIQLINNFTDHIINSETQHLILFFDELWNRRSKAVSYGHDIEAAWLLCEAAEVIGDKSLISKIENTAIKISDVILSGAIKEDGNILYEIDNNGKLHDYTDWWPQAEAVIGFLNSYQITNNEKYLEASLKCWEFANKYLVDKIEGEWHYKVLPDKKIDTSVHKVSEWKGPYHNGRACMEIINRIEKIIMKK